VQIPESSSIKLFADGSSWTFKWSGFDGDDCFASFRIAIAQQGHEEFFDFGPCVVRSLRQVAKFVVQQSPGTSVSGGFQNPGICSFELRTDGERYELIVEKENPELKKYFALKRPSFDLDERFLRAYGG
jgi:hypothetical protein